MSSAEAERGQCQVGWSSPLSLAAGVESRCRWTGVPCGGRVLSWSALRTVCYCSSWVLRSERKFKVGWSHNEEGTWISLKRWLHKFKVQEGAVVLAVLLFAEWTREGRWAKLHLNCMLAVVLWAAQVVAMKCWMDSFLALKPRLPLGCWAYKSTPPCLCEVKFR